MEARGGLGERPALVVMLDVIEDREDRLLLGLAGLAPVDGVREAGEVHEEQAHGGLIDRVDHGLVLDEGPEHIFDEVLHGHDAPGADVQVVGAGGVPG